MEFPFKERSLQENEEVKLLSVGSLVPVKGHEYLIKALNVLRHDHPEVKFNLEIVGDGELKEELENLIIDLSLENYVTLSGFKTQNELIHIYLNAHLFIHPSIETNTGSKEAQGLVIQEAQATGLPVIASRIGGIPEGLIENKTGILVNEKDIEGLKNAVLEMLDRSNQWGEMGRKGRIFVEQEFDVVFQTNKLIEVFNKTLE
jgi:colanic acid/amylovoran biosynthesis glycosyltransferase